MKKLLLVVIVTLACIQYGVSVCKPVIESNNSSTEKALIAMGI